MTSKDERQALVDLRQFEEETADYTMMDSAVSQLPTEVLDEGYYNGPNGMLSKPCTRRKSTVPSLRLSSQAEVQENAFSSLVEGLHKRPPLDYVATLKIPQQLANSSLNK